MAAKCKYSCYMDRILPINTITMYDEMDWMKYALNSFTEYVE